MKKLLALLLICLPLTALAQVKPGVPISDVIRQAQEEFDAKNGRQTRKAKLPRNEQIAQPTSQQDDPYGYTFKPASTKRVKTNTQMPLAPKNQGLTQVQTTLPQSVQYLPQGQIQYLIIGQPLRVQQVQYLPHGQIQYIVQGEPQQPGQVQQLPQPGQTQYIMQGQPQQPGQVQQLPQPGQTQYIMQGQPQQPGQVQQLPQPGQIQYIMQGEPQQPILVQQLPQPGHIQYLPQAQPQQPLQIQQPGQIQYIAPGKTKQTNAPRAETPARVKTLRIQPAPKVTAPSGQTPKVKADKVKTPKVKIEKEKPAKVKAASAEELKQARAIGKAQQAKQNLTIKQGRADERAQRAQHAQMIKKIQADERAQQAQAAQRVKQIRVNERAQEMQAARTVQIEQKTVRVKAPRIPTPRVTANAGNGLNVKFGDQLDFTKRFGLSLSTNGLMWLGGLPNIDLRLQYDKFSLIGSVAYSNWNIPNQQFWWLTSFGGEIRYDIIPNVYIGAAYNWTNYNFKVGETGNQGLAQSLGLVVGYKLPIGRKLALDFGLGLGYALINNEKYHAEEDLFIRDQSRTFGYWGPVKAQVSLVWRIL